MQQLRILIVDDFEPIRRGIRSIISSHAGWFVCGEAADGVEAVEQAVRLRPDIVLMDLSMPRMNGIEATQLIAQTISNVRVIIVSQNDSTVLQHVAALPAHGLVTKSQLSYDLVPAIEAAIVARKPAVPPKKRLPKEVLRQDQSPERDGNPIAAIVHSSRQAMVGKDLDGMIRAWNKGAQRLFGYTAEEAIGKPITLIFPARLRSEELQILKKLRAGHAIEEFETVRVRKNGALLNVVLAISPIVDRTGRIVGARKLARNSRA